MYKHVHLSLLSLITVFCDQALTEVREKTWETRSFRSRSIFSHH